MLYLKTTRPCVASGHESYRWDTTDDVVPVDDVTAYELLAHKDGGFYEVPAPDDQDEGAADEDEGDDAEDAEPAVETEAPRRAPRGRKAA